MEHRGDGEWSVVMIVSDADDSDRVKGIFGGKGADPKHCATAGVPAPPLHSALGRMTWGLREIEGRRQNFNVRLPPLFYVLCSLLPYQR